MSFESTLSLSHVFFCLQKLCLVICLGSLQPSLLNFAEIGKTPTFWQHSHSIFCFVHDFHRKFKWQKNGLIFMWTRLWTLPKAAKFEHCARKYWNNSEILEKVQNFNGRMHTSHLGIFSCSHRFCRCRQNCYLLAIIFQTSEFLLNSAKC